MDTELGFVIDTKASEDSTVLESFISPFPIFTSSKFTLGANEEDEESENSESEIENDADDGEYFGKFILRCEVGRFNFMSNSQVFHLLQ